jgi:hypothetical protein
MTAWCAACDGPQEVDGRGCIACWSLAVKKSAYQAQFMAARRRRLAASGVCINAISHGAPEPGKTKCTRCLEVHRASNRRTA